MWACDWDGGMSRRGGVIRKKSLSHLQYSCFFGEGGGGVGTMKGGGICDCGYTHSD